jgi:hypothetical protein
MLIQHSETRACHIRLLSIRPIIPQPAGSVVVVTAGNPFAHFSEKRGWDNF